MNSAQRTSDSGLLPGSQQWDDLVLEVEALRSTLTEIVERDWWENALDPQWAARIAKARLAGETP